MSRPETFSVNDDHMVASVMGLHSATTFSGPQLLPLARAAAALARAGGVAVVAGSLLFFRSQQKETETGSTVLFGTIYGLL